MYTLRSDVPGCRDTLHAGVLVRLKVNLSCCWYACEWLSLLEREVVLIIGVFLLQHYPGES